MKYLFWALGALLAAAGLVWLAGVLLPPEHEASASLRLKASPEAVWAVLAAVENYPRWRSDVATSEMMAGASGFSWRESDARGLATEHAQGPGKTAEKWVDRLVKGDFAMRGERVFLIVADEGGGTRVALTEKVLIPNPLARFRARFLAGYAENLNQLLADLRKRLAE